MDSIYVLVPDTWLSVSTLVPRLWAEPPTGSWWTPPAPRDGNLWHLVKSRVGSMDWPGFWLAVQELTTNQKPGQQVDPTLDYDSNSKVSASDVCVVFCPPAQVYLSLVLLFSLDIYTSLQRHQKSTYSTAWNYRLCVWAICCLTEHLFQMHNANSGTKGDKSSQHVFFSNVVMTLIFLYIIISYSTQIDVMVTVSCF